MKRKKILRNLGIFFLLAIWFLADGFKIGYFLPKIKEVKAAGTIGGAYIARAGTTSLITNLNDVENTLTYDDEVQTSDNITRQSGNQAFRIQNSGRYLIIANTRMNYIDIENNNRHVVRTSIKVGGTALPSVYGMASGYGRDSGSADEDGVVVAAYIDHTVAGDSTDDITIHIQNFGDTASVDTADQLSNQSGIQIVRLPDDSDYLKMSRATDISFSGTMDYSINDPTWNDFGFETQDVETDPSVIEWVDAGSYGAYITEVLSDTPFYTYILDDTSLVNVSDSGYGGGANNGGTLVGSGLINEFADALEGNSFEITTVNASEINLATTTPSETIEAIVRIDDTSSLQSIYEQGGGSRGLSLSIDSGNLYFSGWNNVTSDGPGDGWGATADHVYASVAIGSTGTYYVAGVYVQESGDDNFDGELRVYIGDVTDVGSGLTSYTTIGSGTAGSGGIGKLYAHSGDAHWADNTDAFIGSSGVNTAPSSLDGALNAIALYDGELSSTQLGDHFAASDDETGPVNPAPDTITLKEAGHYMVIYSIRGYSNQAREASVYRLRLNDIEVPASRILSYVRDNDGDNDSWAQWAGIIEASLNDVLNIDWGPASEEAGGKLNEAAITVVRLPDTADYIRIRYDSNRGGETTGAYPFNQEDEDDDNVHDISTNNSRINGNVDNHDWLLFSSWFLRNTLANSVRTSEHFRWFRSGTEVQYGSGLSYTRGDQASTGVPAGGRNAIVAALNLGSSEYMELNLRQESDTGDQNRDFIANRVGITGIALDTLFVPIVSISVTDGVVSYGQVSESSSKSTIDLSDTQTAENNGNVSENFNIKTSNATNGTQWTVGSSIGTDIFVHEFSTNGGGLWTKFITAGTYQSLASSIGVGGTQNFDLRITAPSSSSDYQQKNITITVQAVQE